MSCPLPPNFNTRFGVYTKAHHSVSLRDRASTLLDVAFAPNG